MKTYLYTYILFFFLLAFLFPKEGKGQSCSGLFPNPNVLPGNDVEDASPLCAPMSLTWKVNYKYVDDGFDNNNVGFNFVWDDGTEDTIYFSSGTITYTPAQNKYEITKMHAYPPVSTQCRYDPSVYLMIAGNRCTDLGQNTPGVYNWDTDNEGSGNLSILDGKKGGAIYYVCENDADTIWFEDLTTLNCNLTGSPYFPNSSQRWIQFEYGTGAWADIDRIPDVKVGSTIVTNGAGTVTPYSSPVETYTPSSPYNSRGDSSEYIIIPASGKVSGQKFEITLHYWNYCNRYDDGSPGEPDNPSVTTTATIEVITKPPDVAGANTEYCEGETDIDITVTPSVGGAIKWYPDSTDAVNQENDIFIGGTFEPITDPSPDMYDLDNNTAGLTTYWVTELQGECESDPSRVDFKIREALTLSQSISGDANVCPLETGLIYTYPVAPAAQPFGGATKYVWNVPFGWTITGGQGTESITVSIGENAVSGNVSVYWTYVAPPICPSNTVTYAATVHPLPEIELGRVDSAYCDDDIPQLQAINVSGITGSTSFNIEYTDGTDTYTKTITNGTNNFSMDGIIATGSYTFIVNEITDNHTYGCTSTEPGDEITGSASLRVRPTLNLTDNISGDDIVCEYATGLVYTFPTAPPDNFNISTEYFWRDPSNVGDPNDWDRTYTPNGEQSMTYRAGSNDVNIRAFWRYATNPRCQSSDDYFAVSVNSLPTVTITSNDTTICDGQDASLRLALTGEGTGDWSLEYEINGSGSIFQAIGSTPYTLVIDESDIGNFGTNTVELLGITQDKGADAGPCAGSIVGDDEKVITNLALPTAEITSNNDSICEDEDAEITIGLAGQGTGDWVVEYRINAGGSLYTGTIASSPYTLTIDPGDLNVGNNTITLLGITQDKGAASACSGSIINTTNVTIRKDEHPSDAVAGDDQEWCNLDNSTFDATDLVIGTGAWTVIDTDGNPDPTIDDTTQFDSDVSINSSDWGEYIFRWTTSNGACPDKFDNVIIDFGGPPDAAAITNDDIDSVCMDTYALTANDPSLGSGEWYSNPVGITFDDENDETTNAVASDSGWYKLIWKISSGTCIPSEDTIDVYFIENPEADAGPDGNPCGLEYDMNATPSVGDGTWTCESKPIPAANVTIDDASDPTTHITVDTYGVYTFKCTENHYDCVDDSTITVTFYESVSVNAGSDEETCESVPFDLSTSTTPPDADNYSDLNWTTNGTGSFDNDGILLPEYTPGLNETGTIYLILEAVGNGVCPNIKDTMELTITPKPQINAGTDKTICQADVFDFSTATTPATESQRNQLYWTHAGAGSLADSTDVHPTYTPSASETGVLKFKLYGTGNGSCATVADSMNITIVAAPVIDAGSDEETCEDVAHGFSTSTVQPNGSNYSALQWSGGSGSFSGATTLTSIYTPASLETGIIKLYLKAFGNGPCPFTNDSMELSITPKPSSNAGSDEETCEDVAFDFTTSTILPTVDEHSSLEWSHDGTGTIDVNTNLTPEYTPGAGETGNVTFTLKANGNGSCVAAQNTMTLTITPKPIVSAGSNEETCQGVMFNLLNSVTDPSASEYSTLLWTTSASGTFNDDATLLPEYTPAANDTGTTKLYLQANGNGSCASEIDSMELYVTPKPIPFAGDDDETCEEVAKDFSTFITQPTIQQHSTLQWSENGSGSLNNNTILLSEYTPGTNETGTVQFILRANGNGSCVEVYDTVELTITPEPTVIVPLDDEVCQAFTFNIDDVTPIASNYDSVLWSYVSGSGTNIGTGTIGNPKQVNGALYTPNTGEAGSAVFRLTVYGQGSCGDVNDDFTLTINASPATPAISGASTVCVGASKDYQVTLRSGISSYDWSLSNPSGIAPEMFEFNNKVFLTFNDNAWSGDLQLQETSDNGCKGDTVKITIQSYEKPTVNAGDDLHVCQGGSTLLGGNPLGTGDVATGGSGNFSYTWTLLSPASGDDYLDNAVVPHPNSTPPYASTFVYKLQLNDNTSTCTVNDTINVIIDPRPSKPTATDAQVCEGAANPALTATGSNQKWYSNSSLTTQVGTGSSYTPSNTTAGEYAYYVTQTIDGCESLADSGVIYIRANPVITTQQVVQNQTVCASNDGIIEVASSDPSAEFSIDNGTSYEVSGWFNNLGTDEYIVSIKNFYNCSTKGDTLYIVSGDTPPAPIKEISDSIYCFEEMSSLEDLEVNSASGGGGIIFWTDNGDTTYNTNTLSPTQTVGTKTYKAYELKGGCTSLPAVFNVTIYNQTSVPVANDTTICYGETVPDLYAEGDNIEWFRKVGASYYIQATGNSFNTGKSAVGTYEYYVRQTVNNCPSPYKKVTLRIKTKPNTVSVSADWICYGEDNAIFSVTGDNIKWYDVDTNIVATGTTFQPTETDEDTYNFFVTQSNTDGCESDLWPFEYEIRHTPDAPTVADTFTCYNTTTKPYLTAYGEPGVTYYWYNEGETALIHTGQILNNPTLYGSGTSDTSTFDVTQKTTSGCTSERATATRIVYTNPANPTTSDIDICKGEDPVLSASVVSGATVEWYDQAGTGHLHTGTTYNTGDANVNAYNYKVKALKNTCYSSAVAVVLTINPVPVITQVDTTGEQLCTSKDGTVTITADDTEGPDNASTLWYSIYGDIEEKYVQNSGNFTGLSNGFYPTVVKNQFECKYFGDTAFVSDGGAPPKPTAGDNKTYCTNESFSTMWATGSSTNYFTWYRNNTLDTAIKNSAVYTPDNVIGTTTYWVTEKSGLCESDPAKVIITINDLPSGTTSGSDSICYSDSAEITVELSGESPFTFTINKNTSAYLSNVSTSDTVYTFKVTTTGNYYLASLSDANTCFATDLGDTTKIVVTPLPISNISPSSPLKVCKGIAATLNGNPGSGTGYYKIHKWTGTTSKLNRSDTSVVVFTSTFPTTYTYTYEVTDMMGCKGSDTITVIVNNNPSAAISPPSPAYVCKGSNLSLNGNPSGGKSPYSHAWSGDTPTGFNTTIVNPTYNGTNGTDTIFYKVTDNNSCVANDTIIINVNEINVNIIPDTIEMYVNEDTIINGHPSSSLETVGYEHTWSGSIGFTDSQDDSLVTFSPTTANTYSLTYQAKDTLSNCSASDQVVIIVADLPATYISPDPAEVCAGIDLVLRAHTTGGSLPYDHLWTGPGTSYLNATNATDVTFNCTTAGDYNLTYTATDSKGRVTTADITVTVHPNPVIGLKEADTVCASENLSIDGAPSGGSTVYNTHQWINLNYGADKFLETTNTQIVKFNSSTADVYGYIYKVTDNEGCYNSDTIYVTNLALPVVDFNADPVAGCSPQTVTFTNNTTGATSYLWEFGDDSTSTEINPSHTYTNRNPNLNDFYIKLTATSATNQCDGYKTKGIKVYSELTDPISVNYDSVCSNQTVNFNGYMTGVATYSWKVNNTEVGTIDRISKIFENTNTGKDSIVTVQLIRTSSYGCQDTTTIDIVVFPLPIALFTIDQTEDCTPLDIVITNASSSDVVSSVWDFDIGGQNAVEDNNATISKTYTNSTSQRVTKTIKLIVENGNGCESTPYYKEVNVFPAVKATFTKDKTAGCSPLTVKFSNTSSGTDVNSQVSWTYGNGETSNQYEPTHIFENETGTNQTYTIKLVIGNTYSCVDSIEDIVTVYPGPVPGFDVDKAVRTYPDTTFTFTNTTIDQNYIYSWDFGDKKGTSGSYTPSPYGYSTRGYYDVVLSAWNNNSDASKQCPNSFTRRIQLKLPTPIANFDSVKPGCVPYTVEFNNTSRYGLEFEWTFNEEDQIVTQNPTYTFIDTGYIPVNLLVTGEDDLTHDTTKYVRVYPDVTAEFNVIPKVAKVNLDKVGFYPSISAAEVKTYYWDFGDGETDTVRSPKHIYKKKGVYTITLVVQNEHLCKDSINKVEEVEIIFEGDAQFPNAFILSKDGPVDERFDPNNINDNLFYPRNIELAEGIKDYRLEIYNRWGVLIKTLGNKDYPYGWNGWDLKGNPVKQDVYIYKVYIKFTDGTVSPPIVGTVTVLR